MLHCLVECLGAALEESRVCMPVLGSTMKSRCISVQSFKVQQSHLMKISGFVFLHTTRLQVLLETIWSHGSSFGADQKVKTRPQSFPHGTEGSHGTMDSDNFSLRTLSSCPHGSPGTLQHKMVGGDKSHASPHQPWACCRPFRKFKSVHAICDASCNALLHLAWGGLA